MYKVISGDDPVTLTIHVERYLTQGWRLQGGIAVIRWEAEVGVCWEFYQAMVKPEPLVFNMDYSVVTAEDVHHP